MKRLFPLIGLLFLFAGVLPAEPPPQQKGGQAKQIQKLELVQKPPLLPVKVLVKGEKKVHKDKAGKILHRGAKPTPRHKLLAAKPYQRIGTTPAQAAWLSPKLEMWLNDQYGDCVSAEECAAKACYSAGLGLPPVMITDATLLAFCQKNDLLNGADLQPVIQLMQQQGLTQDGVTYTDGPGTGIDYSNESLLQNAIAQGPVKIGIDADALPSGAGNQSGWTAFGGTVGQFSSEDHCVGIEAYGPASWLVSQIQTTYNVTVTLPADIPPTKVCYVVYTWATMGIVDHDWLMSTCGEAWSRSPTTLVNGVPEVGPTPAPAPIPTPVPPAPNPVPPTPTPIPTPTTGFSGTVTSIYSSGVLTGVTVVPVASKGKKVSAATHARAVALLDSKLKSAGKKATAINWQAIIAEVELLVEQYGPEAVALIEQYLAGLSLPGWALAIIESIVQIIVAGDKP